MSLLRQIKKRRNAMSNGNGPVKPIRIPVQVPNIGGHPLPKQPQQMQINIADTTEHVCVKCLGQHFDIAVRLRVFSKLHHKNPSGQDALIKVEVYLCRNCGHEYGQPVALNNGKAE